MTNIDNCETEEDDGTGQSLKAVLKIDMGDGEGKKKERKDHIFFSNSSTYVSEQNSRLRRAEK